MYTLKEQQQLTATAFMICGRYSVQKEEMRRRRKAKERLSALSNLENKRTIPHVPKQDRESAQ